MTLTASSASFKGAGRKRKVKQAVRAQSISLQERTTKEQERLINITVMQKAGIKKIEIAKQLDLHPSTVTKYLKRINTYYPHLKDVDAYRINKESLIQAVESQALQSIANTLQSETLNVRDASLAFKTLHQAGRLESNQSTANINNNIQFSKAPLSKAKEP